MFRRTGTVSLALLGFFLLCGDTAPATCNDPPPSHTGAEAAGIAIVAGVVIGTVVLVHVHNSHHNIKGCVVAGPAGIQIHSDGDQKTYTLVGDTNVKVGDLVRVHGSKIKKTKDNKDDETFAVEKLNKDYGPCKASPAKP